MTLLNRIKRSDILPHSEKFAGHTFETSMRLYCHGHVNREQMINFFNIPVNFQTEFDQFKTKYDGFSATAQGRLDAEKWLLDLESATIALQMDTITKTKWNNITGLTLDES